MVSAEVGRGSRGVRGAVPFLDVLKESKWGIGDDEFQERIRDLHTDLAGKARRQEDVSFRKEEVLLRPDDVLGAVAAAFGWPAESLRSRQYGCVARALAAYLLGRYAGMNQHDIGAYLGMGTGSAVCRQMRKLRERVAVDVDLAERMKLAGSKLSSANNANART